MVGSLDDVPFVGRQPELATLRSALTSAADGRPGAVLVTGEAGAGKTRLVRAMLEQPARPPAAVLRAQCVDLGEPGLPYLAMVDVARALRAMADADPEVAVILDRSSAVAALTDTQAAGDDRVDESGRLRLFDAMATVLSAVGRIRGAVMVTVEDLQWVDSSSADFLRFLLSRMSSERVLVVATLRTDGLAARPRARRLIAELVRLPAVQRLELEPFDEAEVAEYLALVDDGLSDPNVVADVLRRSGGNPYYVRTLADGAREIGNIDEGVPSGLGDLLVGRLDGLPEAARNLVRCAAVVSHPVSDRLLRQVAGLPDAVADDALRVAVAEGLLHPDGRGYAFTHDILRSAVYEDMLPGERARLHAAYARALGAGTDGPARPAEVAHHFAVADDEANVVVWSVRAAEEAMRVHAPGEALEHLERTLALWPVVDDAGALAGASRGQLAGRAAGAAGLAGESHRAIEWARLAMALCDADGDGTGAVQARAELVRQLMAVDALTSAEAIEQALRPAQDAVAMAESMDLGAGTTALAQLVLARALVSVRRTGEARRPSDRALAEARTAGAVGLEVEALTTAAFLDEIEGDRHAADDRLRDALRLSRAAGELAAELRAHYQLASLHYYNGDVSGSLPVLHTAMSRASETGLRWSLPGIELRLLHAVALYVSGDLAGSLAAADAPESPAPDVAAARLAAISCYAAVAGGRPDAERRLATLGRSWDADPQIALVAGGCEADRLGWAGDYGAAVAMAARAQHHLDDVVGEGMYGGLWLSALALAALADDASYARLRRDAASVADAERQGDVLLERVERIARGGHGRPGSLGPEGRAWQVRAVAEHARLGGDPAVEQWQRALEAFGYGHAYEQARCRWRLADALVAAGDRAAAKTPAQAAAAAADRMQALPLQRAVAATISRARLAGPERNTDNVLTGREREVLALVAEGLTNREIGKRLFISEKTASVHLSNLMTKLNVSSRTEAVTVAHRRGLLDVL